MGEAEEVEDFREKNVFVICWAGSDRSGYIADELNKRGYMASQGGVMEGQNYVTTEDLNFVGSIVFASVFEKNKFDKDKKLRDFVKRNHIDIHVMNITESDKDRAHNTDKISELKREISSQLDAGGFKDISSSR